MKKCEVLGKRQTVLRIFLLSMIKSVVAESTSNEQVAVKKAEFKDTWLWVCLPAPPMLIFMTVSKSRTVMYFSRVARPDYQI